MAAHSVTDARWVRRLGGREFKIRCACGIAIAHPDREIAGDTFRAYHASLMGIAVPA